MRSIFRYLIRPVLTLCALLLVAGGHASAHHSFAPFDLTKEKTITGTVSKFEWTNPHSWVWVDVPNEKGGVDSWAVEGTEPELPRASRLDEDHAEAGRQGHDVRAAVEERGERRHVRAGDARGRPRADAIGTTDRLTQETAYIADQ